MHACLSVGRGGRACVGDYDVLQIAFNAICVLRRSFALRRAWRMWRARWLWTHATHSDCKQHAMARHFTKWTNTPTRSILSKHVKRRCLQCRRCNIRSRQSQIETHCGAGRPQWGQVPRHGRCEQRDRTLLQIPPVQWWPHS